MPQMLSLQDDFVNMRQIRAHLNRFSEYTGDKVSSLDKRQKELF